MPITYPYTQYGGIWKLNAASAAQGAGTWPIPPLAYDPYFYDVTMLLPGNGTNGAQNNTFLDSSSNALTITRNGNTTQGTFSPYGNLWSNYFPQNNTSYIDTPSSANLNVGAGAFTVEAYVNPVNVTGFHAVYMFGPGNYDGLYIYNGTLTWYDNSSAIVISYGTIPINTWTHVAASRDGSNNLRLFVNGISSSAVSSYTYNFNSNTSRIGANKEGSPTEPFPGYISNLRLIKGTALYTSNFTPSTTPLTAVSGTSLLTCQSNRFIDNSSNNFTLTVNGSPSVQRFSPFNPTAAYDAATIGGSGYFDGSSYLTLADNTAWRQSGDYTIECWYNPSSFGAQRNLIGYSGASNTIWLLQVTSGGVPYFLWYNTSVTGYSITSSTAIILNTWNHIAVTFEGSNIKMWLNGVSVGTTAYTGTVRTSPADALLGVGSWGASTSDPHPIGYMSNTRIVKGTAVYTSAFTPPTSPVTAITNTSLLCNFTNAGIPDAAMMNDLETVNGAQISTAQSKFGGSSMYFSGAAAPSTPILTAVNTPAITLGTGDFTVEGWFYFQSLPGFFACIVNQGDAIASTEWGIGWYSGTFYAFGQSTTTTLAAGTWYHFAATRSNGTLRMFVNGNLEYTGSNTNNFSSTVKLSFGDRLPGSAYSQYPFNGYIDDFRMTKGYARYTSSFTPINAPFQTY